MAAEPRLVVRIDPAAVAYMTRSPAGPTGRELLRRGKQVQFTARQLAPKGMRDGITADVVPSPAGTQVLVRSTHPATMFVIDGTRPHVIRPVRAKALRFSIGGREVFATIVHHPGTKPRDFLGQALLAWRI